MDISPLLPGRTQPNLPDRQRGRRPSAYAYHPRRHIELRRSRRSRPQRELAGPQNYCVVGRVGTACGSRRKREAESKSTDVHWILLIGKGLARFIRRQAGNDGKSA